MNTEQLSDANVEAIPEKTETAVSRDDWHGYTLNTHETDHGDHKTYGVSVMDASGDAFTTTELSKETHDELVAVLDAGAHPADLMPNLDPATNQALVTLDVVEAVKHAAAAETAVHEIRATPGHTDMDLQVAEQASKIATADAMSKASHAESVAGGSAGQVIHAAFEAKADIRIMVNQDLAEKRTQGQLLDPVETLSTGRTTDLEPRPSEQTVQTWRDAAEIAVADAVKDRADHKEMTEVFGERPKSGTDKVESADALSTYYAQAATLSAADAESRFQTGQSMDQTTHDQVFDRVTRTVAERAEAVTTHRSEAREASIAMDPAQQHRMDSLAARAEQTLNQAATARVDHQELLAHPYVASPEGAKAQDVKAETMLQSAKSAAHDLAVAKAPALAKVYPEDTQRRSAARTENAVAPRVEQMAAERKQERATLPPAQSRSEFSGAAQEVRQTQAESVSKGRGR